MNLDDRAKEFLGRNHAAAMTTIKRDGTWHSVRVAVALVGDRLWSSGTQRRARTKHLRRDPRCSLFVFDTAWGYLTLETSVTILEGPDAPEQNLQFFRVLQGGMDPGLAPANVMWMGQEKSPEEFLRIMAEERRLIYEFDVLHAHGLY